MESTFNNHNTNNNVLNNTKESDFITANDPNAKIAKTSIVNICVVGIGGAGNNITKSLYNSPISKYVNIIAVNTDAQALVNTGIPQENCIVIHTKAGITAENLKKFPEKGHGAGADPEVAAQAAIDCLPEVMSKIENAKMVFIIAGEGKGTGTGATPIIAKAAKEKGILVVAAVTTPFAHEGIKQMKAAEAGISNLDPEVDSLMIVPNENLLKCSTEKTTIKDAMKLADYVLFTAVKGIAELIIYPGLMNLDFADLCTIMKGRGRAIIGFGRGDNTKEGKDDAINSAIENPLTDNNYSINNAKAILLHIIGGADLALHDVKEISTKIQKKIKNEDCQIIIGTTVNEEIQPDAIEILVIATGLEKQQEPEEVKEETEEAPKKKPGFFSSFF